MADAEAARRRMWADRPSPALPLPVIRIAVLPGNVTIRGNLPLLALTVGVVVWAHRERRPGLWVVAGLLAPLTLLANLYNMENLLFRLGVPWFEYADQVVNLAVVAIVLLVAAGVFSLSRRRSAWVTRACR